MALTGWSVLRVASGGALLLLPAAANGQDSAAGGASGASSTGASSTGGSTIGRSAAATSSASGAGMRVGNLRDQIEGLVAGGSRGLPGGVAWQVIPSIGVDIGVTDNARRVTSPREADVFTQVTPELLILGDTPRVSVNLRYAPIATLYASTPGQNRFDQYLDAGAQVQVIPERFLLTARAAVTQQSRTGGFGQAGLSQATPTAFNRGDQVQTASFEVSPSLVNRFSGYGTGRVLYSFGYTTQSNAFGGGLATPALGTGFTPGVGPGGGLGGGPINPNNQGFLPQGSLITHRERATFETGENFGRIRSLLLLEATQFDGVGSYRGAFRREASADNAFALNRTVALVGKIGYQQIRYSGPQGYRFSGILWNAGVRLTPNQDDYIDLRYGRRDGFSDFAVEASYAATSRIRLVARYGTGVTSSAESQQNLLGSTPVTPFGGSLGTLTNGSALTGGSFFGIQNTVTEQTTLSLTAVYILPRDVVTLTLQRDQRNPVGTPVQPTAALTGARFAGDTGTFGTANWQHDLTPDLRTNVSLQVGTRSSRQGFAPAGVAAAGVATSERTFSGSAGTSYQFSPTVSGRAAYVFNQRSGGGSARSFSENIVLVGLRKTF